jgi:hypothetical protein
MCDLLIKSVDPNRIDLIVLARDEHTTNSDQMQLAQTNVLARPRIILIHEQHREEQSLVLAVVAGCHFDHPVHHFGT